MKVEIITILRTNLKKEGVYTLSVNNYNDITNFLSDKYGSDFSRSHLYEHLVYIKGKEFKYGTDKELIERMLYEK